MMKNKTKIAFKKNKSRAIIIEYKQTVVVRELPTYNYFYA